MKFLFLLLATTFCDLCDDCKYVVNEIQQAAEQEGIEKTFE